MIRHLFKIIWNERYANGWIVVEYILVFCILWFCCDYLYFITKSYLEPLGFDISNTYMVEMTDRRQMSDSSLPLNDYNPEESPLTLDDRYNYAIEILERLKQYPGVENACLSNAAVPYGSAWMGMGFLINGDSVMQQSLRVRGVSSEFFDVFKIKLTSGRVFDWTDPADQQTFLINPDRNNQFGDPTKATLPATEVRTLGLDPAHPQFYPVIGVTDKLKGSIFEPYSYSVFRPLNKQQVDLTSEITIRVSPHAAKGFEERFTEEMKNQLTAGPYTFSKITSLEETRKQNLKWNGITDNLKSIYAITSFLIINLFLGIIGTFWYRTEARTSEIGLRTALGASRRKIKSFLYAETLLLLSIASIAGINICISIGQTGLLSAIGVPQANHIQIGSGIETYFILFGLTFLLLATVSLLAVWYPARQASNRSPADALHED
jgi:putative ABC transport system permease protein